MRTWRRHSQRQCRRCSVVNDYADTFRKLWRLLTAFKGTIRWKKELGCAYICMKTSVSKEKFACQRSRWLRLHANFSLGKGDIIFLNYCYWGYKHTLFTWLSFEICEKPLKFSKSVIRRHHVRMVNDFAKTKSHDTVPLKGDFLPLFFLNSKKLVPCQTFWTRFRFRRDIRIFRKLRGVILLAKSRRQKHSVKTKFPNWKFDCLH